MNQKYDALALFSGGLDSILACKVIQNQGLKVLGLHFTSPFFGNKKRLKHWTKLYGIELKSVDISQDFVNMMARGPAHGFGKLLNPCMDCKILMLRKTRELLDEYGAKFIISGEVVGQRPMSQRRDAMNAVRRDAEVKELLLRPLCAKKLDPTPMEESGLVDRERLLAIGGRGRKEQLAMAKEHGFEEIPAPAGGCKLTEAEPASRYAPVFLNSKTPRACDFMLANQGRQYWAGPVWLSIGRNQRDNERLEKLVQPEDLLIKATDFPGPLALARTLSRDFTADEIKQAAAFAVSFCPKAKKYGDEVNVRVQQGESAEIIRVRPDRDAPLGFAEPKRDILDEYKKSTTL